MCSAMSASEGQRNAEHHRRHLQRCRRTAVAGVDGGRERQAWRRRPAQVGEDADDLRPEVVTAALTAQRRAGVLGVGSLLQADELADYPVGVRGEHQLLAVGAQHLAQRRDDQRHVAHDQHQVVVGPLDQQTAVDRLGCLLGHGRQQHGLGGAPEARGGPARDADAQVGGDVADQRRLDAAEPAVLRPVELGGGLFDRQQRRRDGQQGAQQTGDDGDESGAPITLVRR